MTSIKFQLYVSIDRWDRDEELLNLLLTIEPALSVVYDQVIFELVDHFEDFHKFQLIGHDVDRHVVQSSRKQDFPR